MSRKQEDNDVSIEKYVDGIIDYYSEEGAVVINAYFHGDITKEDYIADIKKYISGQKISVKQQDEVLKRYQMYFWGYDVLEPLIQDPEITDIHCLGWDHIRVKRIVGQSTVRDTSAVKFDNPKHFNRFIERLCIKNKAGLSEQRSMPKFVDKFSNEEWRLRCSVISDYLTCNGSYFLYIRKERKKKESLDELFMQGMFTAEIMPLLEAAAQGAMIVSGGTGSGKSKLMNALLEKRDFGSNTLILQADDELVAKDHPDVLALHTVDNGEGGICFDFETFRKNAMYWDRQHIIFSEVTGPEAAAAFTAAINGITPWLSLHAPSAKASIYQFINYVTVVLKISVKEAFRMLAFVPFTLVHMKDYRVDEITYMKGWNEEKEQIVFEDVSLWQEKKYCES